jgi:hypothetical protein
MFAWQMLLLQSKFVNPPVGSVHEVGAQYLLSFEVASCAFGKQVHSGLASGIESATQSRQVGSLTLAS